MIIESTLIYIYTIYSKTGVLRGYWANFLLFQLYH